MPAAEDGEVLRSVTMMAANDRYAGCLKGKRSAATYGWAAWVSLYWTCLVVIPCIVQNSLNRPQYLLWALGMVGTSGMYYAMKSGHAADSVKGKPIVAYATLLISVDWCMHSYSALDSTLQFTDGTLMFCHCTALIWATLFFYGNAIESNDKLTGWFTLFVEFVDFLLTMIVIVLLDYKLDGCLNNSLCIGYYTVLVIQMTLWFAPIMFGLTETSKATHIHMLILDGCTDLPLIVVVASSNAFKHWFIFVDVSFKLFLFLGHFGYHGIYHLFMRKDETEELHKKELEAIALADKQADEVEKRSLAELEAGSGNPDADGQLLYLTTY